MMHFSLRSILVALCVAAPAAPAFAFELQPISRTFASSGSGSTQSYQLVNQGSERIAVEVSMWTLERDLDYVESNRPADDDFLIHPAQIILAPGATQTVRVTWVGDPDPDRELSYRIVAEQLPIDLRRSAGAHGAAQPTGGVKILMTYRGTVFVRPRQAAHRVALRSAAPMRDAGGAPALALIFANTGAVHGTLSRCSLRLSSRDGTDAVVLRAAELAPLNETRVLAGARRRYLLPWPTNLSVGAVDAKAHCDVR